MARFARVHEKGRCSRTRQGCGDLATDVPGLAHANDHDTTLTGQDDFAGADELVADSIRERTHGPGFQLDDIFGGIEKDGGFGHVA